MPKSADSHQYLDALRSPDRATREEACRRIFEEYSQRLWRLVWKNLHPRIRQRVDPEEIVNSGIKSLFLDFQKGEVSLDCKEGISKLLFQAVLIKVRQAARRHLAQKRDVFRERQLPESDDSADPLWEHLAAAEPAADEAFFVRDALAQVPEDLQPIVFGKLEGKTDEQLAQEMGYASTEPIRIKKRMIEQSLKEYFAAEK